jgi:hypothetical protein
MQKFQTNDDNRTKKADCKSLFNTRVILGMVLVIFVIAGAVLITYFAKPDKECPQTEKTTITTRSPITTQSSGKYSKYSFISFISDTFNNLFLSFRSS